MDEVATAVLGQLFRGLDEFWRCVGLLGRHLRHELVVPLKPGKPVVNLFEVQLLILVFGDAGI